MKRILRTFLLSILVVMAFGTAAQAKEVYKAIATKQNTWYKPKRYEYGWVGDDYVETYYRYKITVPANYYVTVTLKDKDSCRLNLYKSLKAASYDEIEEFYTSSGAVSDNIVLQKGIYYFGLSYSNGGAAAFKYKFTKYVNKANYKSSKALAWNANKKIAIVQTPGHNYTRWYKIKLTKKKRVYVWGADNVAMLDAKHQYVKVAENNNADGYAYASYEKLKPGIYYIAFPWKWDRYSDAFYRYGSIEIVWWK